MTTKSYEMGYTVTEFSKTLHGQFLTEEESYRCTEITQTQWKISVSDSLSIDIQIKEEPPRKIAMLSLPVLKVQFGFMPAAAINEQALFLKRFFKYFHKGGG